MPQACRGDSAQAALCGRGIDRRTKMKIRYRVQLGLASLILIACSGTVGFHVVEGWAWFDGFYMTLTTMTTIGYGEVHPLTRAGRIFNSFLILTSVIAAGFTIAAVSQALLEFEFSNFVGRRRMERELTRLSNHYIICGAGRVGRTVARELRTHGESSVIIDKNPQRARWAEEERIPVITGDASSEEVLRKAHIDVAKGFVVAVSSDAENLYITLTARGVQPTLKIKARASEEEAIPKLLRAGASRVLSPYYFVGHRIAQLLLRPNVLDFIDTAFGDAPLGEESLDIQIGEVRVPAQSWLLEHRGGLATVRDEAGVIVLALKRADGKVAFNPPIEAVPCVGDSLIVIGKDQQLKKFEDLVNRLSRSPQLGR